MPPFVGGLPFIPTILRIAGVTRNSAGAVLANCAVVVYRTLDDQPVDRIVSDSNGNYASTVAGLAENYYAVAYKVGAPDVAGTTVNTLVGT